MEFEKTFVSAKKVHILLIGLPLSEEALWNLELYILWNFQFDYKKNLLNKLPTEEQYYKDFESVLNDRIKR